MDLQQYMGPIITIIILVALCVAAYFIFKNSTVGKFLGSIFGDLNGMTEWLSNEFQNCSQNGLTSSSCSLGPWIIGGLVLLGIFGLLKAASFLKPFLPEGTRKYVEQYGDDSKETMDEFRAAEAEFNEAEANGTLSKAEQTLLDRFSGDPQGLQVAKDALIKSKANGKTATRRLETLKNNSKDPTQDKEISDGITQQRMDSRQATINDAAENGVEGDDVDPAIEAAEEAN